MEIRSFRLPPDFFFTPVAFWIWFRWSQGLQRSHRLARSCRRSCSIVFFLLLDLFQLNQHHSLKERLRQHLLINLHLSHLKQIYRHRINASPTLMLSILLTEERVEFKGDSVVKYTGWHGVSNLTFQPRYSLLCRRTFLTGFGHLYDSTRSGPNSCFLIGETWRHVSNQHDELPKSVQ